MERRDEAFTCGYVDSPRYGSLFTEMALTCSHFARLVESEARRKVYEQEQMVLAMRQSQDEKDKANKYRIDHIHEFIELDYQEKNRDEVIADPVTFELRLAEAKAKDAKRMEMHVTVENTPPPSISVEVSVEHVDEVDSPKEVARIEANDKENDTGEDS